MYSLWHDLLQITSNSGTALVAFLLPIIWNIGYKWKRRHRERLLWRVRELTDARIVISSGDHGTSNSVKIGPLRALNLITPSLASAYGEAAFSKNLVQLASDVRRGEFSLGRDIVAIGGPRSNWVTQDFCASLSNPSNPEKQNCPPVFLCTTRNMHQPARSKNSEYDEIVFHESDQYVVFPARQTDSEELPNRAKVWGAIIKFPNPEDKRHSVLILAGFTTLGTLAATKYFYGQRRRISRLGPTYALVVQSKKLGLSDVDSPVLIGSVSWVPPRRRPQYYLRRLIQHGSARYEEEDVSRLSQGLWH